MADLAAAGKSRPAGFAGGKWREVIVMHKSFFFSDLHAVYEVGVLRAAQGQHRHDVGGAAIENSGAMNNIGKPAGLGINFSELVCLAAVRSLVLQNCLLVQKIINIGVEVIVFLVKIFAVG